MIRPGIPDINLFGPFGVELLPDGCLQIPYFSPDGRRRTGFYRVRLSDELARRKGRRYDQAPGSGLRVYFTPGWLQALKDNTGAVLPRGALILGEGEFKAEALVVAGIPAIALPGIIACVHREANGQANGNGELQVIPELLEAVREHEIEKLFFLGDSDTAHNFDFAWQAVHLAGALEPFGVEVCLPRFPVGGPKGIDDIKEAQGEGFSIFLRDRIEAAIRVNPRDITPHALCARLVLEQRDNIASVLRSGDGSERLSNRLVKLCAKAQVSRIRDLIGSRKLLELAVDLVRIPKRDFKQAVQLEVEKLTGALGEDRDKSQEELEKAQELEMLGQTSEAERVVQELELYFDPGSARFALRLASEEAQAPAEERAPRPWMLWREDHLKTLLRAKGLSTEPLPGQNYSQLDHAILYVCSERCVDYSGELAGRKTGYALENGLKILITKEARLPVPKEGKWETIEAWFKGLLIYQKPSPKQQGQGQEAGGHEEEEQQEEQDKKHPENKDVQYQTFLGWLKVFLESLRDGTYRHGQVLVLAGPEECGKSVAQKMITLFVGGRMGRASMFLRGRTDFNKDLIRAEHLVAEDDQSRIDLQSRYDFGALIKSLAVNETVDIHAKGKDKLALFNNQRLSISLNNRPERLQVLPPFEEDVASKIILLRCYKFPLPMPMETNEEVNAFWATVRTEIPAFLHWLTYEYKLPLKLAGGRYGVQTYHHPALLRHLSELSPQHQLLEMIDAIQPWGQLSDHWEGSGRELRELLFRDERTKDDAKGMLKHQNVISSYLKDLAKRHKERVKYIHTEYRRFFTITKP